MFVLVDGCRKDTRVVFLELVGIRFRGVPFDSAFFLRRTCPSSPCVHVYAVPTPPQLILITLSKLLGHTENGNQIAWPQYARNGSHRWCLALNYTRNRHFPSAPSLSVLAPVALFEVLPRFCPKWQRWPASPFSSLVPRTRRKSDLSVCAPVHSQSRSQPMTHS